LLDQADHVKSVGQLGIEDFNHLLALI